MPTLSLIKLSMSVLNIFSKRNVDQILADCQYPVKVALNNGGFPETGTYLFSGCAFPLWQV